MDSLIGEMVRDSFGATGTVLRYDPDFRYYVLRLDNSGEMVRRTSGEACRPALPRIAWTGTASCWTRPRTIRTSVPQRGAPVATYGSVASTRSAGTP